MKTAISIEDQLLQAADETARVMGLSRSGLFALALNDFLKRRANEKMLEQLNEVYGTDADQEERRVVKGMKAKARAAVQDRW